MKIVYISRSIIPSRTANSINVMRMCEAFASLGHEVILFAPWTKKLEEKNVEDPFEYYGVKNNFKLEKIFSPNIKYLKKKIYSFICLQKVKKLQPDLVYGRDDIFAFYLTKRNGFTTLFERHEPFVKNDFNRWIFTKFLKLKQSKRQLVVITENLKKMFSETYSMTPNSILVIQAGTGIYNHHDLPLEYTVPNENINIGYIGSLLKGKGIEIIIELSQHFSNINFQIIGGNEKDIAFWKKKSKDSNNLTFHGFINPKETYKYRNMCDILIAPYQTQSAGNKDCEYMSPIKIFEYMASKKAIICSSLPGIKECIDENHVIFADNTDINSWIEAVKYFKDNPEKIKHLANNAYEHSVQNFTYEARASKVLNEFK